MDKKESGLIEKFKKLEVELLKVLSESNSDEINLEQNKSVVKSQLKTFAKNVDKARKLFDEYELIAQQIEDLTSKNTKTSKQDSVKNSIADAIVNLRQSTEKDEYVDKLEAVNGNIKVTKKKKNKSSAKEY